MYQRITLHVTHYLSNGSIKIEDIEFRYFDQIFVFLYSFRKTVDIINYHVIIRGYKKIPQEFFKLFLSDLKCINITHYDYFNPLKDFKLEKENLKYYRNINYIIG